MADETPTPEVGDPVIYVDPKRRENNAVVIAVWPDMSGPDEPPGVNLAYADPEEGSQDSYGRQVARDTSVVHQQNQAAPGRYWRWPE